MEDEAVLRAWRNASTQQFFACLENSTAPSSTPAPDNIRKNKQSSKDRDLSDPSNSDNPQENQFISVTASKYNVLLEGDSAGVIPKVARASYSPADAFSVLFPLRNLHHVKMRPPQRRIETEDLGNTFPPPLDSNQETGWSSAQRQKWREYACGMLIAITERPGRRFPQQPKTCFSRGRYDIMRGCHTQGATTKRTFQIGVSRGFHDSEFQTASVTCIAKNYRQQSQTIHSRKSAVKPLKRSETWNEALGSSYVEDAEEKLSSDFFSQSQLIVSKVSEEGIQILSKESKVLEMQAGAKSNLTDAQLAASLPVNGNLSHNEERRHSETQLPTVAFDKINSSKLERATSSSLDNYEAKRWSRRKTSQPFSQQGGEWMFSKRNGRDTEVKTKKSPRRKSLGDQPDTEKLEFLAHGELSRPSEEVIEPERRRQRGIARHSVIELLRLEANLSGSHANPTTPLANAPANMEDDNARLCKPRSTFPDQESPRMKEARPLSRYTEYHRRPVFSGIPQARSRWEEQVLGKGLMKSPMFFSWGWLKKKRKKREGKDGKFRVEPSLRKKDRDDAEERWTGRGAVAVTSVLPFDSSEAKATASPIGVEKKKKSSFFSRFIKDHSWRDAARTGTSYAHLLDGSQPSTSSGPLLDDQTIKSGRHRVVMNLPGFMQSIISFVRVKELKLELNAKFAENHPWLHPSLTLSKLQKVRQDLTDIAERLNLEVSTVALAYLYLEKLVLKHVVIKDNRKLFAATCLVIAFKYNEVQHQEENQYPQEQKDESSSSESPDADDSKRKKLADMFEEIEDILGSKKKDILKNEFHTFVLLEFSLNVTADEIRPYFLYFRGALDLVIPFGEQWA